MLFESLKNRPFVQKRGEHWAYHPTVRETMLRHLKALSENDWETLHAQLSGFYLERINRMQLEGRIAQFQDEQCLTYHLENCYHQLCENYNKAIPVGIQGFATTLKNNSPSKAYPWVATILDAEVFYPEKEWGQLLQKGLAQILSDGEKREHEVLLLKQINASNWIQDEDEAAFFYLAEGNAFYDQGQLDQAIEQYQKAIELNPSDATAWHSLGWNDLLLAKLTDAETHLQKAWELSENKMANAPMNLGHVQLLQGNRGKAIEWYKQSLTIWKEPATFFQGMEQDYLDLKMEEFGITIVAYQAILKRLKEEI